MTEPFELGEEEEVRAQPRTDAWIVRVNEADAEAEERWERLPTVLEDYPTHPEWGAALALIAIAAELRAQRISRRPGWGKP